MQISPCAILLVIPEFFQMLMVNVLILFSLLFSTVGQPTANISNNKTFQEKAASIGSNKVISLYTGHLIKPISHTLALAQCVALGFICSALLYYNNSLEYGLAFGLVCDKLSQIMSIFLCLSGACAIILSSNSLKRFGRYEILLILWLSAIGMHSLIKSYSFLALYLSIELQSLSFYMLTAMRSRNEASSEASLKYFILSAFASAMLLLGITLIYGTIGSQSIGDLYTVFNHLFETGNTLNTNGSYTGLYVGIASIIIALLFKLGAAPLHAWIADVYEGSQTSITAWFAITAKIAVLTVLIRLNTPIIWASLLVFAAATSLIIGSVSAMRQVKLKRLIAFSAVANAGWFLAGLAYSQWQYALLHLVVYTTLSIQLFSVFILPLSRTHPDLDYQVRHGLLGNRDQINQRDVVDFAADSNTIKYISDLNQAYKTNPGLAIAITIGLFSLAGIPPLAGFYSKYLILHAISQSESLIILAIALATAVISAFYYIRVIKTIYFESVTSAHRKPALFSIRQSWVNAYITALTTALTLGFFLRPDYIWLWIATI